MIFVNTWKTKKKKQQQLVGSKHLYLPLNMWLVPQKNETCLFFFIVCEKKHVFVPHYVSKKFWKKQLLVFSIFSNFFRNFGSKPCNQVRVIVQKKGLDNIVSARYWTFSSPFMSNKHVCWKKKVWGRSASLGAQKKHAKTQKNTFWDKVNFFPAKRERIRKPKNDARTLIFCSK